MSDPTGGGVLHGQKDMQDSDGHLLSRFATDHDEAAFKTLADRYLGLVYHVALRRTGNRQMAEEISQNVLCAVVRKAAALARHPDRLPAWLHRATLFESSKAMRSEASRQRRQQIVSPDEITPTGETEASAWTAALPVLDLALDRLPDADRSIVLRHYFEGKSFNQIGAEVSRPAATVQKQCRRALDKLARVLRGKGVVLSATALAAGLASQTAKAAPPFLMKSAAAKALAGASSYSTTSLTLFMAMNSKASLPLVLLLLAAPLALQQVAISRTISHNDRLRHALVASAPATAGRTAERRTVATDTQRITLEGLRRAYEEAEQSTLKRIEFEEMIAALKVEDYEFLIPGIFALPDSRQDKIELLRHLVGALAKTDPGLAVRLACKADPQGPIIPNAGIEKAIFQWTAAEPEQAIEWLLGLHGSPSGSNWHAFSQYQAAVAAPLILSGSPHAREILTLPNRSDTGFDTSEVVLRIAIGMLHDTNPEGADSVDFMVSAFSKFLPWIRESTAEDGTSKVGGTDRRQVIELLLSETGWTIRPTKNPFPGKILETVELLPSEHRVIVEYQALQILETPYNTHPRPNRPTVDAAARQWLQTHAPDEAEEIFTRLKTNLAERERREIASSLDSLATREVLRDDDLIRDLGQRDFSEFTELIPQALEQAQRIKDPAKRAELMLRLEASGKSAPSQP